MLKIMLYGLFKNGFSTEALIQLLLLIPIILISLTLHELAHGYVAYKCGDNTAKAFGRLTLNPASHLDLFGALMLLIVGFGWAKPVPINMRNFRKPRRDLFLVSIAGIVVNLILGLIGVILLYGILKMSFLSDSMMSTLYGFFFMFSSINIGLAVFNLIPLPPLDGSKVLSTILPPAAAAKYLRIEYYSRYIFIGIVLLSWAPAPFSYLNELIWLPFEWARESLLNIFGWLANLIFHVY